MTSFRLCAKNYLGNNSQLLKAFVTPLPPICVVKNTNASKNIFCHSLVTIRQTSNLFCIQYFMLNIRKQNTYDKPSHWGNITPFPQVKARTAARSNFPTLRNLRSGWRTGFSYRKAPRVRPWNPSCKRICCRNWKGWKFHLLCTAYPRTRIRVSGSHCTLKYAHFFFVINTYSVSQKK